MFIHKRKRNKEGDKRYVKIFLKTRRKIIKGFHSGRACYRVAILAILVGILAPQYTKYVEKSRKAADASNLENLVTVVKTAASDSTDTIAAGTYKITITKDGTTVTPILRRKCIRW